MTSKMSSSITPKLEKHLPFLKWAKNYNLQTFIKDIIAGITVCGIHIPQGITYGNLLAGQAPKYGLYTSFIPVIVYAFLGTSQHISTGTYAILCLLIGETISEIHPDLPGNATAEQWEELYSIRILDVSAMTFYISVILIVSYFLNAGFLVRYLSVPMMNGFTAGAAVHIFSSQVSTLFGLDIERQTGPGKLVKLYREIVFGLIDLNEETKPRTIASLVFGISLIAILIVVRFVNSKCKEKYFKGIPLPGELIVLALGTILTYFFKFNDEFQIPVVGTIPNGLPSPTLPNFSCFPKILSGMIPVIVIGYASHMATSSIFAIKHGYEHDLDPNQELIALSVSNFVGCFFTCIPSFGSVARSCIKDEAGCVTNMAALVSSGILIFILLVAASVFYYTPKISLSVTVLVSISFLLGNFKRDFFKFYKVDRIDALVWVVSCLSTIFIDVVTGLAVSVGFCLLTVVFRTQFDGVGMVKVGCDLVGHDGLDYDVVVLKWNGALHYLNKDLFRTEFLRYLFDKDKIIENTFEMNILVDIENPKRWIIVELNPPFTDYDGVKCIAELIAECEGKDVLLKLVNFDGKLEKSLVSSGLLENSSLDISAMIFSDVAKAKQFL